MDGSTEGETREGDSHWSSSRDQDGGNAEVGHQYVGVERYVLRVKVRSTVRHESTKRDRAGSEWSRHI